MATMGSFIRLCLWSRIHVKWFRSTDQWMYLLDINRHRLRAAMAGGRARAEHEDFCRSELQSALEIVINGVEALHDDGQELNPVYLAVRHCVIPLVKIQKHSMVYIVGITRS